MAHESFEDPATAAVMNELFVNIKVDREERPDIDHVYMSALHSLGEQGGWPLTMFLTADGEPFWGGTYFPPEARYGRPVLHQCAEADRRHPCAGPGAHRAQCRGDRRGADSRPRRRPPPDADEPDLDALASQIAAGLRSASWRPARRAKIPQSRPGRTALAAWQPHRHPSRPCGAATRTLERMARGGIHDHLGGGFARYSVDERWLVPHFEKMLYDNAQLLELYALEAGRSGDALARAAAEGIVAWLEREMLLPEGRLRRQPRCRFRRCRGQVLCLDRPGTGASCWRPTRTRLLRAGITTSPRTAIGKRSRS